MRVIGYVRVSTEEQSNKGVSLDAQRAKLEAYAELYELELLDVIVDAGFSAKTLDRPGLQQALVKLDNGDAEAMLVYKLDRLTRSVSDMGTLINNYFGSRFNLLSVSDQIDTRSAAGRLVLNVLTSVAQWEREVISERTQVALAHKKAQGEHVGSASFGYKMVEKKLARVEQEHQTIAVIQDMRNQGHTLQAIADYLNANGYQTQRGGKWYPTTITNVLKKAVNEQTGTG